MIHLKLPPIMEIQRRLTPECEIIELDSSDEEAVESVEEIKQPSSVSSLIKHISIEWAAEQPSTSIKDEVIPTPLLEHKNDTELCPPELQAAECKLNNIKDDKSSDAEEESKESPDSNFGLIKITLDANLKHDQYLEEDQKSKVQNKNEINPDSENQFEAAIQLVYRDQIDTTDKAKRFGRKDDRGIQSLSLLIFCMSA